jgi:hypothetical protein
VVRLPGRPPAIFWENLFRELAGYGRLTDTQMINSTHVKAHRPAAGGKGREKIRLRVFRAEGDTRRFMHSDLRLSCGKVK